MYKHMVPKHVLHFLILQFLNIFDPLEMKRRETYHMCVTHTPHNLKVLSNENRGRSRVMSIYPYYRDDGITCTLGCSDFDFFSHFEV